MGISPTRQGQNNNATQDFLYFSFYLIITFEVFYIYYLLDAMQIHYEFMYFSEQKNRIVHFELLM